ncbi:MAG: DNA mismatch repair protein MutS, partial [Acidobacteriales bacterium]
MRDRSGAVADANVEYRRRLLKEREAFQRLERLHLRIGKVQIGLAALAIVLTLLALVWSLISVLWTLAPLAAMVALAFVHDRVLRGRTLAGRVVAFYEYVLDRVEDRWAGKGETGERFLDQLHPYAKDLDLFGHGSLFEYLNTARTRGGEEALARWLLYPAPPEDLRARHEAIRELVPQLDLREQLAVLAEDVRAGVHPDALSAWGAESPRLAAGRLWALAAGLSVLAFATAALWILKGVAAPFIIVFVAGRLLAHRLRNDIEHVVAAVDQPGRDLQLLTEVLSLLERQHFASPRLATLRAELDIE